METTRGQGNLPVRTTLAYVQPQTDGTVQLHRGIREILARVNLHNRGSIPVRCGTVVQLEQVSRVLSDNRETNFFVPTVATVVATERFVDRYPDSDVEYGGSLVAGMTTNTIACDGVGLDHYALHMSVRSWMMVRPYLMDFGPNHCDCRIGMQDDAWFNQTYIPTMKVRYFSQIEANRRALALRHSAHRGPYGRVN